MTLDDMEPAVPDVHPEDIKKWYAKWDKTTVEVVRYNLCAGHYERVPGKHQAAIVWLRKQQNSRECLATKRFRQILWAAIISVIVSLAGVIWMMTRP